MMDAKLLLIWQHIEEPVVCRGEVRTVFDYEHNLVSWRGGDAVAIELEAKH